MSPQSIVVLQRKMVENYEAKLFHWKNKIKKMKRAALLLKEDEKNQIRNHKHKEMGVDVDFSEGSVQSYRFYTLSAFRFFKEQYNTATCDLNALTDLHLTAMSERIVQIKLPH